MYEDFIFEILNGYSELNFKEASEILEEYYYNELKHKVIIANASVYCSYKSNRIRPKILPCVINAKYSENFKEWKIYVDNEQDDNEDFITAHIPSYAQAISPEDIDEAFRRCGFENVKIDFETHLVLAKRKCIKGHCKVLK